MTRVVLFVLAVVLVAFAGCADIRSSEEREQAQLEYRRAHAWRIVYTMYYFQDDRTQPPLCYGYLWEGASHGGPALATVPCESVRHLLVNRSSAPGVSPSPDDGTGVDRQGL